MATLYNLTEEMVQLMQLAEDPEAEDINPEVFADTFEALDMEFEDKVEAYGMVIQAVEGDAALLKAEIDRLTARMRSFNNSAARMKEAVKTAMIATCKPKVKTARFTFSVQKNPPKVVIDNPSRIYDAFLIPQEPKIDTAAIKAALKNEDEAPMWDGIAHLEQGESLRIR